MIKKEFYDIVAQFPSVVNVCDALEDIQRSYMFEDIDICEIMKSASVYFQKSIVMEGDTLSMEQGFCGLSNQIQCLSNSILYDNENNPFLHLIKRKFRYTFTVDVEIAS